MSEYHSRNAPILNPFDQLSAPAFDTFVADVTTAIRNALNPPVAPVAPRAAVRMPGFGSPTPERSSAVSSGSVARDVEVVEIDNSDKEEEEEELAVYSRESVSSGSSQLEDFSSLPGGVSSSGDQAHLEHEDLAQWVSDYDKVQQYDEEQEEQEEEQGQEEEEQEDQEKSVADDYFIREGSLSSNSNVSTLPPMPSGNAKGKARAIDEGPGVQALQGISERLYANPELFVAQSSSEDDEPGSYDDYEEQNGENGFEVVYLHSYHSESSDWNQEDEEQSFSENQDEQESGDDNVPHSLGNDPNRPLELSDSEEDESQRSQSPADQNTRSRSTSTSESSGRSDDILEEEEQSKDAGAFALDELAASRVAVHISPQAIAYSHLMADYNDADEESDPDSSVRDEKAPPYDEQDWSGNGPLRGAGTSDFALADTNNEDEDVEDEFNDTGDILNGGSARYQEGYISASAQGAESPITLAHGEEELREPNDHGAENGDSSYKVAFPDPNLPPPPTDLIIPDIVRNSRLGFEDTSISNIAQPSATPAQSEQPARSLPGFIFDSDDTGIPSFDMFRATDHQVDSRSRSPEIDVFDLETPGEPGESLIEDIYIASHGHDESTPSTPPDMEPAPTSPASGSKATLLLPSEHHVRHLFSKPSTAAAAGFVHSVATVADELANPPAAPTNNLSQNDSGQVEPKSMSDRGSPDTDQPDTQAADDSILFESGLAVTHDLAVPLSVSDVRANGDIPSGEAETYSAPSGPLLEPSSSMEPSGLTPTVLDSIPLASLTSYDEANNLVSVESSSARSVSPAPHLGGPSVLSVQPSFSTVVESLDTSSQDVSFSLSSGVSIGHRIPTVALELLEDAEVLEQVPAENLPPIPVDRGIVNPDNDAAGEAISRGSMVDKPDLVFAAEIIDGEGVIEKTRNHDIPSAAPIRDGSAQAPKIGDATQHSISDADGDSQHSDPGMEKPVKQSAFGSDFGVDNGISTDERSPHLAALEQSTTGNSDEHELDVGPGSSESDNLPTPRANSPDSRKVDDNGLFSDNSLLQPDAHVIEHVVNDVSSAASSPREGTPTSRKRKRRTSLLVDEASPARNTRSRTKESSDHYSARDSLPGSPASTSSWASDGNRPLTPSGRRGSGQQPTQRGSSIASAASVSGAPQETSPRPYVLVPRPQIHHHSAVPTPGLSNVNRAAPNSSVTSHITRSQCRFHKISAPGLTPDEVVHFVVPYCSLSATDVMKEEGIIDCGLASDEDNRNKITDVSNLDAALASVLRKLVGPDLMHEEVCGYLPSNSLSHLSPTSLPRPAGSPIPAARRGHKRGSSRLRLEADDSPRIAVPSTPPKSPSTRNSRSLSQHEDIDVYEPSKSDQLPKEDRGSTPKPHSPKVLHKPYVDLVVSNQMPDTPAEDEDGSLESEADDEYRESTSHVGSSESGTPPPASPSTASRRFKRKRKARDSGALPYKPGSDGSGSDADPRPKHKRRRRRPNAVAVAPLEENGLEVPKEELGPVAEAAEIVGAGLSGSSTDRVPVLAQSAPAAGEKPRWAPTSWIPRLW